VGTSQLEPRGIVAVRRNNLSSISPAGTANFSDFLQPAVPQFAGRVIASKSRLISQNFGRRSMNDGRTQLHRQPLHECIARCRAKIVLDKVRLTGKISDRSVLTGQAAIVGSVLNCPASKNCSPARTMLGTCLILQEGELSNMEHPSNGQESHFE
jgi:hypothetical protein